LVLIVAQQMRSQDAKRLRPSVILLEKYKCPSVVRQFSCRHRISYAESLQIFGETKKWIWLKNEFENDHPKGLKDIPALPLLSHFRVIDEMWHTFILFTVPYTNFCDTFFGVYIHHHPNVSHSAPKNVNQKIICWFVDYLSDKLGEETAEKWLNIYPIRYSLRHLHRSM